MATPTFDAIGFCAHYSEQGDWAFDYALRLSRMHGFKLNVFHFLKDPYVPNDTQAENLSREEREKMAVEREKELRLYYDQRAGDYLDVGFRVCYDESWTELHRCLLIREFQVLVLGYPNFGAYFAKNPIEEFSEKFVTPVVLVGPERPDQFYLNHQAEFMIHKLDIPEGKWSSIKQTVE